MGAENKKFNRIGIVLAEKGLKNKELAEMLKMKDPSLVSKWVTNASQPQWETLFQIAELLDMEARDLIRLRNDV